MGKICISMILVVFAAAMSCLLYTSNYSYDEDLFVVSDGSPLRLSDLTALDTLRVVTEME